MNPDDNDRSFQRWLNKAARATGLHTSTEERQRNLEQQKYARCEKWKAELLNYSTCCPLLLHHVYIIMHHHAASRSQSRIHAQPPPIVAIAPSSIICAPCDSTRSGGFHPAGAIVLCLGHFGSKKHMEDTLAHELVHMYDHCKFNVDWQNLRHHASFSKQHQV